MNVPQPPRCITTDHIVRSQDRVKLVCGFYGPTHPKCKQAVDYDTTLYIKFLKQFQVDDDDVSES